MKLYTEEQVIKIVNKAFWQDVGNASDARELMSELTPIELPSDEKIEKKFVPRVTMYELGYRDGAEWVIEQIKQQDNGH